MPGFSAIAVDITLATSFFEIFSCGSAAGWMDNIQHRIFNLQVAKKKQRISGNFLTDFRRKKKACHGTK